MIIRTLQVLLLLQVLKQMEYITSFFPKFKTQDSEVYNKNIQIAVSI